MDLVFSRKDFVFIALIAISIILWGFFLNASGILLEEILKFENIKATINSLTAIPFILFVVLFPLTIAIATVFCEIEKEKKKSFIVIPVGVLIGLIVSMLVFSNLMGYWLAGIFYIISFFLLIEMSYTRLEELKKYVSMRLLSESVRRTVLITAIGLFMLSALTVLENKEAYEESLEGEMISFSIGEDTRDDLAELSANMIIQNYNQILDEIISTESFQALKTSPDPNAIAFALGLEESKQRINSSEYRREAIRKANDAQEGAITEQQMEEMLESMKDKMPLYGLMMQFLWLILGFALFSVFLLLGNTVFMVLGIIYGLIIITVTKGMIEGSPAKTN